MTSKYAPLWDYIKKLDQEDFFLSFDQIKQILGFEIDHSFLCNPKEVHTCLSSTLSVSC